MVNPVDPARLAPDIRRLAERGSREAFGVPLDRLLDDLAVAGEIFDEHDLETLVLAGRAAERADAVERATDGRTVATQQASDGGSLDVPKGDTRQT